MYTPKPVPSLPGKGKSGQSLESSIAKPKDQGGPPAKESTPAQSTLKTKPINFMAGTKGSTGKVNSIPPRCGGHTY